MYSTISLPLVNKIYRGDVAELRFKKPLGFAYSPGQCVDIYHPDGECRVYSIASGTLSDSLTFMIKKLPQGKLSNWIYDELKEGDVVRISNEAYGFFEPGNTDKDCVFIATGTGVAPFISYIETFQGDETCPLKKVYYGMRYQEEMIPVPFLDTQYCLSKDTSESPRVYNGRVTDYLSEHPEEIDTEAVYYVCGLDDALRDISELLTNNGVPVENIIHEVFYFKAH